MKQNKSPVQTAHGIMCKIPNKAPGNMLPVNKYNYCNYEGLIEPWLLSNSSGSPSCKQLAKVSTGIIRREETKEETVVTLTKILQKDLYSRKVRCSASSQESRWSNSSDIFLFLDTDGTRWVTCRFHLYDGLRATKKSRQSFVSRAYIMWISEAKLP